MGVDISLMLALVLFSDPIRSSQWSEPLPQSAEEEDLGGDIWQQGESELWHHLQEEVYWWPIECRRRGRRRGTVTKGEEDGNNLAKWME